MLALVLLDAQRIKQAFRMAGFLLVLSLLCGLEFAEAQQARVLSEGRHIALPQLSDGMGWKQPKYYSTIQTVDLDDDGQSEVLARWIDGLEIYRFENGTLLRHSRIPALSDNAGFYQPSWYSTIRAAVLEPKLKQADIIAREHDGIHVFRYQPATHTWLELGFPGSVRPFADTDAGGTDWTQAKYYSTIQLADVTGDGAAELLGRGRNGVQTWQWDAANQSWTELAAAGELADAQGFDQEAYYYSIQLVDIDGDGIAELIARAPDGVQTFKSSQNGWTLINGAGPFGDSAGLLVGSRYKSVRVSVDAAGRVWLYGLTTGTGGDGSGAIRVYQWQKDHWQLAQAIPLPGLGWDRESQSATLRAADIQGDDTPEFVVRGRNGLHAYSLDGNPIPSYLKSFTDAQGWNLNEESDTLRTATGMIADKGASRLRTLVIGRGSNGLEAYKFTGQWADAAEANFPQYCANFNTDKSVQCVAYKALSEKIFPGRDDIRSAYTESAYNKGNWRSYAIDVSNMANPNNDPDWLALRSEVADELGYVGTVRGWFDNNYTVLNDSYNRSADLLGQAQTDVSLASSTGVAAKWVEFVGDTISGIVGSLPEAYQSISLVITILEDTYNDTVGSGDINEPLSKIYTNLNNQQSKINTTNASQQTAYLTNYAKLQQIGTDSATGGYDWADATETDISDAKNGAAHGMLIDFYRMLLPVKWQVYWCDGNTPYGGPSCGSFYTETKYNCLYGAMPAPLQGYTSNAYIYAGSSYVNWGLLDRLTGPLEPKTNNLNAIWYMMLLGGDLGWDLPQYGSISSYGPYLNTPDPQLAFDQIEHGYKGPSANCSGNGSFNGIVSTSQTLSARLSVAQQNSARVTASDAPEILEEVRALEEEAKAASPDRDVDIDLTSPLRAAAKLIKLVKPPTSASGQPSVSATTPTHLTELFIRRAQLLGPKLGEREVQHLTTHAYCLMGKLEGQSVASETCQR